MLHPPTVGVGAYVYPKYEEWGLSWWVGAPMWLWVDDADPLQWGEHSLDASLEDAGITASVEATRVVFDPGDGSKPVVCQSAGTPRPWDPKDRLDRHSPSRCEHVYEVPNEKGEVDSRYAVSATVEWEVEWRTTDGQSGVFTVEVSSVEDPSVHVGQIRAVLVPG
jgi:hypothetical protein